MSGDCGHGWMYHSGGAGSPCDKCTEEAAKPTVEKLQAEIERLQLTLKESQLQFGLMQIHRNNYADLLTSCEKALANAHTRIIELEEYEYRYKELCK